MNTSAPDGGTPFTEQSFPAEPGLVCDVVMKGGITSGVMYPWAICELAQAYRLSSVGGASAGAIAAAAAAAAEVGRADGGFLRFAQFPVELNSKEPGGDKSLLFRLFQPSVATRRLHALLVSVLDRKDGLSTKKPGAVIGLLADVVKTFPLASFLGAVAGLLVLLLGAGTLASSDGAASAWARVAGGVVLVVVGLVLALLGGLASVVRSLLRDASRLPAQGFGLCTGMPDVGLGAKTALTPWLETKLQELSGRPVDGPPLTFGDLDAAGVRLRMMTTDLSSRQPRTMPWDGKEFFFDPEIFERYFPGRVVKHMTDHPSPLPTAPAEAAKEVRLREAAGRLRPWPAAADLPVIVATRMSLSFPLLISAVPLQAYDVGGDGTTFEPHWFSDGGLCSNLPVHFFDAAMPRHPTFAINLVQRETVDADQARNVWLADDNSAGRLRSVLNPVESARPTLGPLGWFAGSLLDTARVWVDEAQLVMPGYRDRVVRIFHTKAEGGLNLDMDDETVTRLSERGRQAAVVLRARFEGGAGGRPSAGMDNHRWVRYRSAMAGLADWLGAWLGAFDSKDSGATPYPTLLADRTASRQGAYALRSSATAKAMEERTGGLRTLASAWAATPTQTFTEGRPRPAAQLRLVPEDQGARASDVD